MNITPTKRRRGDGGGKANATSVEGQKAAIKLSEATYTLYRLCPRCREEMKCG
jgi:hypothetical protein